MITWAASRSISSYDDICSADEAGAQAAVGEAYSRIFNSRSSSVPESHWSKFAKPGSRVPSADQAGASVADESGQDQRPAARYCISSTAEVRTVESIPRGEAETPFLKAGYTVSIEMLDDHHHSIVGAIEQTVEPLP